MNAAGDDDVVVRVQGLSKMYKVYQRPADLLKEVLTGTPHHEEFWAVKDVSFELRRGEILGVVGSNGAGKSTLLKLIAGTLDRTAGTIEVRRRVSAILELGSSFNAEMTGRENVRTALTYAGLPSDQLEDKIGWIAEFSELGAVLDHPFRTYSSGMQARLTFSTAVASMEDLLLIDEALAAGDAAFVNKSLRHMEELCRREHVSAIVVSHSILSLVRLCNRGLYLRDGNVVSVGSIADVARDYESVMLQQDEMMMHEQQRTARASADRLCTFRIERIVLRCDGRPAETFHVGGDCEVAVYCESDEEWTDVWVGLEVYSASLGVFITTLCNRNCRMTDPAAPEQVRIDIKKGKGAIVFHLSPLLLGGGSYHFHFLLFSHDSWSNQKWQPDDAILYARYAGQFRVKNKGAYAFEQQSLVQLPLNVSVGAQGSAGQSC